MAWSSIKDTLESNILQKGLTDRVQEAMVLAKANEMINSLFGSESGEKARAVYLQGDILTIAVLSNSLLQEIETQGHEFVRILNSKLGSHIVSALRFLS